MHTEYSEYNKRLYILPKYNINIYNSSKRFTMSSLPLSDFFVVIKKNSEEKKQYYLISDILAS